MTAENGRFRAICSRLLGGVPSWMARSRTPVPDAVADALRHMAEEPAEDSTGNPYEDQKRRFNRIWAWRPPANQNDPEGQTPEESAVARFTTLRGALTAYWTSEKWAQAWAGTGALAGLGALTALNVVWVSKAGADFLDSLQKLAAEPGAATAVTNFTDAATNMGLYGGLSVATYGAMMFAKMDMQRRMAGWMTAKFNEAIFQSPEIISRLTHNKGRVSENGKDDVTPDEPDVMPDNPHQRIFGAVQQMSNMTIHMASGLWATVLTSAAVAMALHEHSVPVGFLDEFGAFLNEKFPNGMVDFMPGDNGTFTLALATVAAYAAISGPMAYYYGSLINRANKDMQRDRGSVQEKLVKVFDGAQSISESGGHREHKRTIDKVYSEFDKSWRNETRAMAGYYTYNYLQSFAGHQFVSAVPGIAGLMSGSMNFQQFLHGQFLVSGLLSGVSWALDAVPDFAMTRAAATRVSEMAKMVVSAQDASSFYGRTGPHNFVYGRTNNADEVLHIQDAALYHRGEEKPFLQVDEISVARGDKVFMQGVSGCGKSSLFKAIMALSPYGEGAFSTAPDCRVFMARQEPDVDKYMTLSELVAYGAPEGDKADEKIEEALRLAGLGKFAQAVHSSDYEGKSWNDVLSGGQKQRLVLARILYQQPDILLLDEATSALNPQGQLEFFNTLQQHCPQATVLAIMHADARVVNADTDFAFNKRIVFADGKATIEPFDQPVVRVAEKPGGPAAGLRAGPAA